MTNHRGMMTAEVRDLAADKYGFQNFSVAHLRLLPYLQYLVMNNERLNPAKINQEEREILSEWRNDGRITGGAGEPVAVSKYMWEAMSEILWVAYVRKAYESKKNLR